MEEALRELQSSLESVASNSQKAINAMMSPELMKEMTPKQLALMNKAKNAFNLGNLTPEQKLDELTKILKDVSSNNG